MRRIVASDAGQAVVEFALVLPILLLVFLGLAQFGLILNAQQQLVDTARQGARTFALTADPAAAVAAVRLSGRQVSRFDELSQIAVEVSSVQQRREVTRHFFWTTERQCRRFLGFRYSCRYVRVLRERSVEQIREVEEVSMRFAGPLTSVPSAQGRAKRGEWATVTVTYAYPNPIQASIAGFRLPATIPLATRAVARMEEDAR